PAHVAGESRRGTRTGPARRPLGAAVRAGAAAVGGDPLAWATGGGEDYELLVTCHPGAFARLVDGLAAATGTLLTGIGEVAPSAAGVRYTDAAGREVAVAPGFEHFVTERRRATVGPPSSC